jgi:signal peptidase II
MTERNRRVLRRFFVTATLVFLLDQGTKLWALGHLLRSRVIIPHFLHLQLVFNDGAAWNLLSGHRLFLISLSIGVLALGVIFRRHLHLHRPWNCFALGLVLGGLVGNLLDRLRLGTVVDFIDVHLPFYRWPAFNVADGALCVGLLLCLLAPHFFQGEGNDGAAGAGQPRDRASRSRP